MKYAFEIGSWIFGGETKFSSDLYPSSREPDELVFGVCWGVFGGELGLSVIFWWGLVIFWILADIF